jgi:hypothetical protein
MWFKNLHIDDSQITAAVLEVNKPHLHVLSLQRQAYDVWRPLPVSTSLYVRVYTCMCLRVCACACICTLLSLLDGGKVSSKSLPYCFITRCFRAPVTYPGIDAVCILGTLTTDIKRSVKKWAGTIGVLMIAGQPLAE